MLTTLLLLSLSATPPAQPANPDGTGSTTLEPFFRQPDRMEIFIADTPKFLIKKGKVEKEPEKYPSIGSFAIKSKGVPLSAQERQAIAQTWVPPQKIDPESVKMCIFNPDIALRFWRGKSWVDAVVCFSCSEAAFYDEKGQPVDGGNFKNFSVLSEIAKKKFPQEKFGP
ncbi:MAG TPA: hypothetical protein VF815_43400 [Myxococcaceae bacterium]|jgi:hypothetical protein